MKLIEMWERLGRDTKSLYGQDQDIVVFNDDNCVQKAAEGRVSHIISSDRVDRYGDVIEQDGWDLEAFMKNPVVQWAHSYSIPPIGLNKSLVTMKHKLKAITEFVQTAFAQELKALVDANVLRAWSVGFRALEYEYIKADDEHSSITGIRFIRSELMEYSLCPIPANPDCLNLAYKALDPLLRRTLEEGPIPNSYSDAVHGDLPIVDTSRIVEASTALKLSLTRRDLRR